MRSFFALLADGTPSVRPIGYNTTQEEDMNQRLSACLQSRVNLVKVSMLLMLLGKHRAFKDCDIADGGQSYFWWEDSSSHLWHLIRLKFRCSAQM